MDEVVCVHTIDDIKYYKPMGVETLTAEVKAELVTYMGTVDDPDLYDIAQNAEYELKPEQDPDENGYYTFEQFKSYIGLSNILYVRKHITEDPADIIMKDIDKNIIYVDSEWI